MPLLMLTRHLPVGAAATSVGGGIASGAEIAGSVGGVVGALVAVAGLFIAIAGNNSKRRREYDREIREAEDRGAARVRDEMDRDLDRAERDMEFWRGMALANRRDSDPIPVPPSQRQRAEPRRRAARPADDDQDESEG